MIHEPKRISNFKKQLAGKGLKLTRVRRHIYDRIARLKGHFDADTLYALLKKENSGIARGTVYRTIPLFMEFGLIQKSGSTYKYNNEKLAVGYDATRTYLRENNKISGEILKEIRSKLRES